MEALLPQWKCLFPVDLCNCSHTTAVYSGQGLLIVAGLADLLTSQCICGFITLLPLDLPLLMCVVEADQVFKVNPVYPNSIK